MGLVTLAAFAFLLRPYRAIAEPDTQIGGGTDLTRTLKLDNKSAEWDAIVEKLSIQRQVQEEERKAAEIARKKAEAEAIAAKAKAVEAAQQKVTVPTVAPVQKAISGTKTECMTAAGIPQAMWLYVDSIVTRESGWNPNAVNKSSGACGLGQQLPCGKWAGAWNDPIAALKAMTIYVDNRYGGWAGAVAFWNRMHWY